MKNHRKRLSVSAHFLILLGLCLLFAPDIQAVNIAYPGETEENYADTYKSISYHTLRQSPVSDEETDGVDLSDGNLTLQRTDLYLEGTGGMDFSLNRYYRSSEADLGLVTVEQKAELDNTVHYITFKGEDKKEHKIRVAKAIYEKHAKALKDMFYSYEKGGVYSTGISKNTQATKVINRYPYHVYGLGTGWSYDLPWIETTSVLSGDRKDWQVKPAYLHLGSKGTLPIAVSANQGKKAYEITGLTGYEYQDIQLIDFEQTVDGITCRYLLRDKTGMRTYFNEDGVVVLQKDCHNNTITYSYKNKIYLDKIIDSVGRTITFQYEAFSDGTEYLKSVSVEGNAAAGGVKKRQVTYEAEKVSYTAMDGQTLSGTKLKSAKCSGVKENYTYRTVETLHNAAGNEICTQRSATNQAYLLTKASSEGAADCYEYRASAVGASKNAGEGITRDVVTQRYYVTREYRQDTKTEKKAKGIKYDYYQKRAAQNPGGSDILYGYQGFYDNHDWRAFQTAGIQNVTIVSTYNPRKHKNNKKVSDYRYAQGNLNLSDLSLVSKPKKTAKLYVYNQNGLLLRNTTEGKTKSELAYSYDKEGGGRLVAAAETRNYGSNRSGTPVTSREEYTYDVYGNEIAVKSAAAFLPENAGKEQLFTTTYTFHGNGYPADDTAYCLELVYQTEGYLTEQTKKVVTFSLAASGVDTETITEKVVENGNEKTIAQTVTTYDAAGNETSETNYPEYENSQTRESIKNSYEYNSLGQQTKETVTVSSEKYPKQNTSYSEESTYDSFGNLLSSTDKNGLVTQNSYREETEEVAESKEAIGTEFETKTKEYTSEDGLKSLSIDSSGAGTVTIQDAFGNTILEKNEAGRTWTERTYDYGAEQENDTSEDTDSKDGDGEETEEDTEKGGILIEERIYSFSPEGEFLTIQEDGAEVPNFDIGGKGEKLRQASRFLYNENEEQIGSAEFHGGTIDASCCTGWRVTKTSEEVSEGNVISKTYVKELNPSHYEKQEFTDDYYTRFDNACLSETVTEQIYDGRGNLSSEAETLTKKGGVLQTKTSYQYDIWGKMTGETTVTEKEQGGTKLPQTASQTSYEYDTYGNLSKTIVKQKQSPEADWETKITRSDYNTRGQLIRSYDEKGTKEEYATTYEYDMNGRVIETKTPAAKTDGEISYHISRQEYDNDGNQTVSESQQNSDSWERTEYEYDKMGQLVCVKNCLEEKQAQYTQYAYDANGNKIRQYTGMKQPLTITVAEGEADSSKKASPKKVSVENFTCNGKTYHIEVSGGGKKPVYSEMKYEYNERNELVRMIDGEGREETYTYDEEGNAVQTVDKNKNTHSMVYDNQNRLIKEEITPTEKASVTEPETITHTYEYDAYGDLVRQDNQSFSYQDVNGELTKEVIQEKGRKPIEKSYAYNTGGSRSSFTVRIGDKEVLATRYEYDGFSRLKEVKEKNGSQTETIASYTYDENGNLSGQNYTQAGLATDYSYDAGNRLTKLVNRKTGQEKEGQVQSGFTMTYQKNGQLRKVISTVGQAGEKAGKLEKMEASYTYDRLGRLIVEKRSGGKSEADKRKAGKKETYEIFYTYDSFNNRKEMKNGNMVTAYRYNKNNELLRTDRLNTKTESNQVTVYRYDKNGNQLAALPWRAAEDETKPVVNLDITLGENRLNENTVNHYNAENQVVSTLTKDKKVHYGYDAEGLRTKKTVNGKEITYVWDGDQLVLEVNQKDEVTKRYLRGSSLICADKGSGTEKTYYLYNAHGDVIQLANEQGEVKRPMSIIPLARK